ncbi:MAG: hypothetical protein QXO70_03560 [Candidatus Pacearchaeota archaeon]
MKYKFTLARKRALKKARNKRMRTFKKAYPVGSVMMLDVGKPKGHYQFVRKTKYGWEKANIPRRLIKAGWKKIKKGYVLRP